MKKQGELTRSGKRRSPGGKVLCTALAVTMLLTTTASATAKPWWLSKYRVTFDNELGIVGNVTLTFASDGGSFIRQAKFEPKKSKMRKPGTGCISKINDHLYEGRYSPKDAYGKRVARNIYAPTREECEEKLAVLIKEMKAEIAEQKAKLKNA